MNTSFVSLSSIFGSAVKEKLYLPITDLNFFYTKEERLMQTSLTVKLKVNLLKGHMPENLALLKILFH